MAEINGIPEGGKWTDLNKMKEEDILAAGRADAKRQFALQQIANKDAQEAATRSNIAKAAHDAMMAIANNMK
jgi:hypothetical protein